MKKKLFTSLLLSMVICIGLLSKSSTAAHFSNVLKKDFPVSSFTKIEIGGPFNVYIRQGTTEQVYVEADERVMNKVKVKNQGDTLIVDVDDFSMNIKKLSVFITLMKVDYMKIYNTGNIEGKGIIKTDKLTIDYSRTGNMSLELDCQKLILQAGGTGNIDISGTAVHADIQRSGIGNLSAERLNTDYLKVNVTGVGNTSVFANKEISINASGVGNLNYSGNAIIKEYKVTGVGNVSKQ